MPRFEGKPVTSGTGPRFSGKPVGPDASLGEALSGGVYSGVAQLLGLPGDIMGLDSTEFIKKTLRSGMEAVGADPEKFLPQDGYASESQRLAHRIGEEIGASVIPAGAMLRRSTKAAEATGMAAQSFWNRFFAPAGRTPVKAAGGELAATAAAGAGGGIAEEIAPGSTTAEMAGEIAGGAAPGAVAITPAAIAARLGRRAASYVSPAAQAKRGAEAVKQALGREMTDEATANLTEAERLRKAMPGFDPTLAEATGSPALLATQRSLEHRATGTDLDRIVQRRQSAEEAVSRFAAGQAPEGSPTPDFIIDTANRRVEGLRGAVEARTAETGEMRAALAENIPRPSRQETGQTIRDQLNAERSATQTRMSELADELGIDGTDVSEEFQAAAADLVDEFKPRSRFEDTGTQPDVIRELAREVGGEGEAPVTTFADLKALRERVSDDLIDAIGSANPNRKAIRQLTMLKGRVDDVFEGLTRSADPDLARRYQQFRRAYFDEYINRFETAPVFRVRQRDNRGFYRTPDERVAEAFFSPGATSAADNFNAVFRDNPEARAALEGVALDSLADHAVRDGTLNASRMQDWLRKHDSVLEKFPELRQRVAGIAEADRALIERQAQLAQRTKTIEDQILVRELKSWARSSKASGDVINAALKEPRLMDQLVTALGKGPPDALNGLKRHIWDRATEGTAEDILKFANANRRALQRLLGPEHLRAIQDIAAARFMLQRTPEPRGAAFEIVPLREVEQQIGQGLPQLASRVFAFKSGRMQKGYLAVDTLMRGLRGRAKTTADDLFRQALYDPKTAKAMLETIDSGHLSQETAKRLNARIFALGLTAAEGEQMGGEAQ